MCIYYFFVYVHIYIYIFDDGSLVLLRSRLTSGFTSHLPEIELLESLLNSWNSFERVGTCSLTNALTGNTDVTVNRGSTERLALTPPKACKTLMRNT